ncbi:hypothetical protein [Bradyrhizobium sp. CCBAU 51753]|uniref:hypothetical protein n=1 Tax=Bradyrhizobium sp. CCBAU 51753 TaxID=1325100 RepID=UPI00188C4DFB|nr:hypothetical protein [Bradyrhizobium sp. CCBAU 51753]QOZ26157.1 hypothetical protein XH93_23065 [Bradyrhizobium sp. CCBAU 51753]
MSIIWLTYQKRIDADLDDAFREAGAETFFSQEYVRRLAEPIKQLDEWLLKLFVVQFAIIGFLAVEFVSTDATFSLFGLSLKNAPGLKEILLALSATIAIAIGVMTATRDTTVSIIQGILKRTVDKRFVEYETFAAPAGFHFKLYLPREHKRGYFPTRSGKVVTIAIAVLGFLIALSTIAASLAVHWMIIKDIWLHPTLGNWSYFVLSYVASSYALNLLVLLKRTLPFPYEDSTIPKARSVGGGPWGGRR